jgi:hypothetical protein
LTSLCLDYLAGQARYLAPIIASNAIICPLNNICLSLGLLCQRSFNEKDENKMTKLTRFFATSLLVVSMSAIALADGEGGILQTPPAPAAAAAAAAAECTVDCSSTEASTTTQPVQDSTADIATTAQMFAVWLVNSIL